MRLQRRITTADWRRTRYSSRRLVVGAKSGKTCSAATLFVFGARELEKEVGVGERRENLFFTGKPQVDGLGHAFLMRNYRAGLGKWQTADPMGYPDGWNQLAYCNNGVTENVDLWGAKVYAVFSISNQRLVVYDWDTNKKLSVQAFSGKEGCRSVEYQWTPNVGPLPLGNYTIVNASEAHPSWFELWREDEKLDDETFGPGGVRRGEFRLHEGNVSMGCITMKINDTAKAIIEMIGKTSYEWKLLSFKKVFGTLKVIE